MLSLRRVLLVLSLIADWSWQLSFSSSWRSNDFENFDVTVLNFCRKKIAIANLSLIFFCNFGFFGQLNVFFSLGWSTTMTTATSTTTSTTTATTTAKSTTWISYLRSRFRYHETASDRFVLISPVSTVFHAEPAFQAPNRGLMSEQNQRRRRRRCRRLRRHRQRIDSERETL